MENYPAGISMQICIIMAIYPGHEGFKSWLSFVCFLAFKFGLKVNYPFISSDIDDSDFQMNFLFGLYENFVLWQWF